MAQDPKKPTTGGNKPKPVAPGGGQSAKDKSRAQSRPVSTKSPTGRPTGGSGKGGSGGGNRPRPGGRPEPEQPRRRISGTMIAWGSVGLVVVIIAVVVLVSQLGGSSNSGGGGSNSGGGAYTPVTAAPASVVNAVTNIPDSVYNTVGTGTGVQPPIIIHGHSPLTLNGKSPAMLFYGAEYCPYCAAERWAVTAALARFGTWSGLQLTGSSQTDVYANTHTFSYRSASLSSPYLHFTSVEQYTNIPLANSQGYTVLQNPNKEEARVISTYNSPNFIPGAQAGQVSFPFIDINNLALISGASFNPGILAGKTWSDIAKELSNPSDPATQAIVGTANYISAAICASTNDAPASVCKSAGVTTASKALKLTA